MRLDGDTELTGLGVACDNRESVDWALRDRARVLRARDRDEPDTRECEHKTPVDLHYHKEMGKKFVPCA